MIKSLKREKEFGSDELLNEYFIESVDILSLRMVDLFNVILTQANVPLSSLKVRLYLCIKRMNLAILAIKEELPLLVSQNIYFEQGC